MKEILFLFKFTTEQLLIFLILVGVFIVGAGANIPILNKTLWKLPIIGSFRVIDKPV